MPLISTEQLTACKRLLFISPVALGDFLYLKTFLIALKHQYSHIELDIWLDDNRCNDDAWRLSRSKILQQWMEAEGVFTRTYGCSDSLSAHSQQIEKAKLLNYDIIFTHSGNKSEQFSKLAHKINSKSYIVSSVGKVKYWGIFDRILFRHSNKTYRINEKKLPNNHHITDRYYQIINQVTGLHLTVDKFLPSLKIPQHISELTNDWLENNFTTNSGKLFFLNHLSTNKKRDWKLSQLFELVEKIVSLDPGSRFVINVSPENVATLEKAITKRFSKVEIAVFTARNNFFELPSMISKADQVITVETAIMHFATAAKRPLISLMRPKKSYWAPPETKISKVIYAKQGKRYVSDISVERVFNQYTAMNTNS
ncbi:lipopolysaccharide heptosyltransferase family protein [Shewanella sp. 10N.7]|uniref:glycosyltransferase family 9 protein n=1 Tax=Shewanella sp. 10N.7 TaxID=2885093 RepID=UPI001E4A0295|nr:glycosyltransferase family 9 protein [Shewanella sp. 10N.7]MCC4833556.1 lipopolysaccharide heptosyltransferase family protein [Shewanella sp. 10N.7]